MWVRYSPDILQIFSRYYSPDNLHIFSRYSPDILQISFPRYSPDILQIFSRYSPDIIPQIFSRYSLDILQVFSTLFSLVCQWPEIAKKKRLGDRQKFLGGWIRYQRLFSLKPVFLPPAARCYSVGDVALSYCFTPSLFFPIGFSESLHLPGTDQTMLCIRENLAQIESGRGKKVIRGCLPIMTRIFQKLWR